VEIARRLGLDVEPGGSPPFAPGAARFEARAVEEVG